MSSATLTRRRTRQPAVREEPTAAVPAQTAGVGAGTFFLLGGLATAAVAVVLLHGQAPAALGLVVFTLLAAGLAGLAFFRVLAPLVGLGGEAGPTVGGRARAALERDKGLTLRAIKELEFDRAMGKVSEADFVEMRDRLRQRAMRLMRQLEGGGVYRQLIERDVASRVPSARRPAVPAAAHEPAPVAVDPATCIACGTVNDTDARFCKQCGEPLAAGARA
jgi:hypothetical protein